MTQPALEQAARAIVEALRELQIPYALIGGLAVSARTEPRFTRDVDLAVAVENDKEAEATIAGLRAKGFSVLAILEQEAADRLATTRLHAPTVGQQSPVVVDLLFASSGIENEIVEGAEVLELLPDFELPIASLAHLLALKTLARDDRNRPQDLVDIRALVAEATEEQLAKAREALELITSRGFHRNRDLATSLDEAIAESPKPERG